MSGFPDEFVGVWIQSGRPEATSRRLWVSGFRAGLGLDLRRHLKAIRVTQSKLAQKTDLSVSTIRLSVDRSDRSGYPLNFTKGPA